MPFLPVCAPPYLTCPGVWAREELLLGFLLGLPAQVYCLLSPRRLQCREGLQLGWRSQEEPMGRRALWGQGGKGPVGKKQTLPRLGGRPGCPHHAPLWLSTHGPHLSPQLRVFSPSPSSQASLPVPHNQGSSPEPIHVFICLPPSEFLTLPSVTLTLDSSSRSPCLSSQVALQEMYP